jgi:citrate lyase subunit beta / citryl-CoA lyase
MRSWLYVPGNSPRKAVNAGVFGADGLVFDLEDSVAARDKDEARLLLCETVGALDFGSSRIAVRINGLETRWWREDLEVCTDLAASLKLTDIRLPKVESASMVRLISQELRRLEMRAKVEEGTLRLQCIIETPAGLRQAYASAEASLRVSAICFGAEDYCSLTGVDRYGPPFALDYPRSRIVSAAAAVNAAAYDTVWGAYRDADGLKEEALRARALGFSGKSVIHPDQIAAVNAVFSPTEAELAWAERIVQAAEGADADRGAFGADGYMVDAPVVRRAQRIVSAARSLPGYSGKMR